MKAIQFSGKRVSLDIWTKKLRLKVLGKNFSFSPFSFDSYQYFSIAYIKNLSITPNIIYHIVAKGF